jgi:predicted flap endonuclease-1-like 5' DNA nuclease
MVWETWQIFVLGLLVGWLAELVIDYFFWRKRRICSQAEEELQAVVKMVRQEVQHLPQNPADPQNQGGKRVETDPEEEQEEEKEPDDLELIWGIGPKIEVLLYFKGITTFKQLAATDLLTLHNILADAGPAYKISRHNLIESWNDQARLAADGRWSELSAYQAKLPRIRRSGY